MGTTHTTPTTIDFLSQLGLFSHYDNNNCSNHSCIFTHLVEDPLRLQREMLLSKKHDRAVICLPRMGLLLRHSSSCCPHLPQTKVQVMQGVTSISLEMVKAVREWSMFSKSKKPQQNNSIMDIDDQTPSLYSLEEKRVPVCFSRQRDELDRPVKPSMPTMRPIHQSLTPLDGAEAALCEPQQFSILARLAQTAGHP